jgi:hypothetical protein
MSEANPLEVMRSFGAEIINGKNSPRPDVRLFPGASYSDIVAFLSTVRSHSDRAFRVGFSALFPHEVTENFPRFSAADQSEFRKVFLDFARAETDDFALPGILATLSRLYSLLGDSWPELVAFTLADSDADQLLRGNVLAALDFVRDEAFVESHSNELIPILRKFMATASDLGLPRTSFLLLLALCRPAITPDLLDDVWSVALATSDERERRQSVYPAFSGLCEVDGFREVVPPTVALRIDAFLGGAGDDAIGPVLEYFPFLDEASLDRVVVGLVSAPGAEKLIEHLEAADLELLSDVTVNAIYAFLCETFSAHKCGVLGLLGTFAELMIRENEEAAGTISGMIMEGLKSDSAKSACVALRASVGFLDDGKAEFFGEVLRLLKDAEAADEAYRAMKALLETGEFSTAENAKVLLDLFGNFSPEEFGRFAKLVSILLGSAEEPSLLLASPVYDFAVVRLSGDRPPFEKAVALSLFGDLLEISNDFVKDHLVDCIQVAIGLVNGDDVPSISFGADFLSRVAEHLPEEHRSEIFACIPKFMELLGMISDAKVFRTFARAVCEILSLYDVKDSASQVAKMAIGCDDELLGSELVGVLSQSLLPEVGVSLFDEIADLLTKTKDVDVFGNYLIALKGIVKKYQVTFETCQALVHPLINGRSPLLPDLTFLEDDLNFFAFLKTFIKKFKAPTEPYCIRLMIALPDLSGELFGAISGPIEAGLKLRLFGNEVVTKFMVILRELINENEDDPKSLVSLLGMVLAVTRNYPECIETAPLLSKLGSIWEACGDDEELKCLPLLILELAAASQTGEGIQEKTLLTILDGLPYPPDCCDLQFVLAAVMQLIVRDWAQKFATQPIAALLATVLVMTKKELNEYQVEPNTLAQARNCLKVICAASRTIEAKLRQMFAKSRRKLIALAAMLK